MLPSGNKHWYLIWNTPIAKWRWGGGASKQSVLCYVIKQIWAGQVCSLRLRTPPWAMRQQEQSRQPCRGWMLEWVWLAAWLIPARNRTLQPLLPSSTFVTHLSFRTLKRFTFARCGKLADSTQVRLWCLHQMIKASCDCTTGLSLKRYVRILSQKIQELPLHPLPPHWSCALAPRFTSAETGIQLLLQALRKLTFASHHNQKKGVCNAPLSHID